MSKIIESRGRRATRPVTAADRKRALAMLANGMGRVKIANELGVSAATVRQWACEAKAQPTEQVAAQVRAQLAEGKTPHQIAGALRLAPAAVLQIRDAVEAERQADSSTTSYALRRAAELLRQGFDRREVARMTKLALSAVKAIEPRKVVAIDRRRRGGPADFVALRVEDFVHCGGDHPA